MAYILLWIVLLGLVLFAFMSILAYLIEPPAPKTLYYEKRFEPANNKYFIVKVTSSKEIPVCHWYGRRIFYKDLVQVEYVLEKLNSTK